MELKSLNPPKTIILSIEESSSRLRQEISNAFKPAREVLKKYDEYCKNMGSELSHMIEESKKAHPAAFRYNELCMDNDPNFLIEIRKHTKAVAKKKGFADCYITPEGLLHSNSLQDLPEEALAEILSTLGDLTLGEFEKVPLRVWDKVKTIKSKTKDRELLRILKDIESVARYEPLEPINELIKIDALDPACRKLPAKQFKIVDLLLHMEDENGNRINESDAARILGISRNAVNKCHKVAKRNLKTLISQAIESKLN